VNLERRLDHEDHPASLPSSGGVTPPVFVPNGVAPSWCQRDGGANGEFSVLSYGDFLLSDFICFFYQHMQCSSLILVICNLASSELYFSQYDQLNWSFLKP